MKKLLHLGSVFLLTLLASCASDQIEIEETNRANAVHLWHYNGDSAVLKKVIEQLKNGSSSASLERKLAKNDVLWNEAMFIYIENKKRILVPFLSEDKENVIGVLSLAKDSKGIAMVEDMTVRTRLFTKNNKLPFWSRGEWIGYFMALDKDILGIKNGNPGLKKKAVSNDTQKMNQTICQSQYLYDMCVYSYQCYSINGGESWESCSEELEYCYPVYGETCWEVPDQPTDPGTGDDGSDGGSGSGTLTIATFFTPKITNLTKELKCFNQNSGAKLTIYAEQSIPNSRQLTSNIGHTFIGITQNGVTRNLGFYPDSPNAALLSSQTSEIHDNSGSEYDVSVTINITSGQLTNIIQYITNYPGTYDLNNFNCTDFGIKVMSLGGLTIPKTVGNYSILPGLNFSGRNPSDLGQDLRILSLPTGATRNTTSSTAPTKSGTCP
ncbi:hypothetical protein [Flavobacterium flavigenum]|uniref:hypothetical protein n=1 Tax=Flavobacterium flavigenum TaxID=3003258 RepID=UPI0022AC508F|nr:hypothetical protein [Flavobacterium flavigenum]